MYWCFLQVLAWSAESPNDFKRGDRYIVGGNGSGKTYHSVWDPVTNKVTSMLVANTNHDMFCPGITMMSNGDVMVTGGQNADRTSIYQLASNSWVASADMAISRGYGSSCLLSNGKVSSCATLCFRPAFIVCVMVPLFKQSLVHPCYMQSSDAPVTPMGVSSN